MEGVITLQYCDGFLHTSSMNRPHEVIYSLHRIFLYTPATLFDHQEDPRIYGVTGTPQSWLGHWIQGDRSWPAWWVPGGGEATLMGSGCLLHWGGLGDGHPCHQRWKAIHQSIKLAAQSQNPGYKQTSQWKSSLFNKTSCRDLTSIFCY